MEAVKDDLLMTFFAKSTCRIEDGDSAELIFSGYGKAEQYPSLINVIVYEGIDNKVNYHYKENDVIRISDEHPVAYCPFAQKDISRSLIRGCHRSFSTPLLNELRSMFNPFDNRFIQVEGVDDMEVLNFCNNLKTDDLDKILINSVNRLLDVNLRRLEKNLKDYDVREMADLAESVVDLTGFHRILTFEQESVGGPVDVAVITKNDGFTWLSRKSWYHHKDVNGMYGSMGI